MCAGVCILPSAYICVCVINACGLRQTGEWASDYECIKELTVCCDPDLKEPWVWAKRRSLNPSNDETKQIPCLCATVIICFLTQSKGICVLLILLKLRSPLILSCVLSPTFPLPGFSFPSVCLPYSPYSPIQPLPVFLLYICVSCVCPSILFS